MDAKEGKPASDTPAWSTAHKLSPWCCFALDASLPPLFYACLSTSRVPQPRLTLKGMKINFSRQKKNIFNTTYPSQCFTCRLYDAVIPSFSQARSKRLEESSSFSAPLSHSHMLSAYLSLFVCFWLSHFTSCLLILPTFSSGHKKIIILYKWNLFKYRNKETKLLWEDTCNSPMLEKATEEGKAVV